MPSLEQRLERGLFGARWVMAPLYVGLALTLFLLLFSFAKEFLYYVSKIPEITPNETILGVLSLIDLSLAGNLVLIVIYSGYENFVSKMNLDDTAEKFDWKGTVDFSTLKLKLIASIVAISGIHLLKVFMDIEKYTESHVKWMIIIHLVFVISGVLLALMDKMSSSAKKK